MLPQSASHRQSHGYGPPLTAHCHLLRPTRHHETGGVCVDEGSIPLRLAHQLRNISPGTCRGDETSRATHARPTAPKHWWRAPLFLISAGKSVACRHRKGGAVATVETVRGQVPVDDLGPTLMHEHIFALSTEHMQNYGDGLWWDEDVRVADAVSKLRTLRRKGI